MKRARDGRISDKDIADHLTGIVSIAADAIISIDSTQTITLFNDGAEVIFGYRRDEVLGQALSMLLPEGLRHAHEQHVSAFGVAPLSAKRMGDRGTITGRRKSGEVFRAEASISKIDTAGGRLYTAVLRDVTERLAAEQKLADSHKVLEIALDVGEVGIFEHDHATGIHFWSPQCRRILGLTDADPAGIEACLSVVHPEDRDRVARAFSQSLDPSRDGLIQMEHRILRKGRLTRWLSMRACTSFAGTKPHRTIGAVLDITERRATQELLERRIAEATQTLRLEIARREASEAQLVRTQRMEAFGQLTGGVAHDFNNLLTVISGNLELLEMRLGDENQRKLLRRAQDAADMGARLTGRLLTFARRRNFAGAPVNLNDQVIGVAELLRRTLGEHIALTTSLERSLWTVVADTSEIENAILNLAINARDAMPGGGKLMIETANVELDATREDLGIKLPPGDYVRLSATDTGAGMTPDVMRRAFEPFFTTKDTGRGTGLGLSTIYGFVTGAGGTVSLYSEVGKGTTVNIYLPRMTEAVHRLESHLPSRQVAASSGERVLLVEDNPEVRLVTKAQLEGLGYVVTEADSGAAAIRRMTDGETFALVFSDVVMAGGVSGFDVVSWVKAHSPSTRVLLASGYPDALLRSDTVDVDNVEILRKPFSRAMLAEALERALA